MITTRNGTKLHYKDKDILNSIFEINVFNSRNLVSTKTTKEISRDTYMEEEYIEQAINRLRKAEIIILKAKNGIIYKELTKYGHKVLMELNRSKK